MIVLLTQFISLELYVPGPNQWVWWSLAGVLSVIVFALFRWSRSKHAVSKQVDREFLPAALEILETPPSPIRVATIGIICLGAVTLLVWGYLGKLDIHAVAAGKVKPRGNSKIVQSVDPGRVVKNHVREGARVTEGDLLLELDPTETAADRSSQETGLAATKSEVVRRHLAIRHAQSSSPLDTQSLTQQPDLTQRESAVLVAELGQLTASREGLKAQLDQQRAQIKRLKLTIEERQNLLAVLRERVENRDELNQQKFGTRATVIDAKEVLLRETTTDAAERGQVVETEAAIRLTEWRIEEVTRQFVADQSSRLADSERRLDLQSGELTKAAARYERTRLFAPIAGTVQQLAVTTNGQVVSAGQSLMTIVPADAAVEVEAMILNQDIGFIELNQVVVVKVDAFPFTRYGTIQGTVTAISRDAIADRDAALSPISRGRSATASEAGTLPSPQSLVFPITISLALDSIDVEGKPIPLSAGMAVTAEIKTGERRALDYVLSPLVELYSSTAHER